MSNSPSLEGPKRTNFLRYANRPQAHCRHTTQISHPEMIFLKPYERSAVCERWEPRADGATRAISAIGGWVVFWLASTECSTSAPKPIGKIPRWSLPQSASRSRFKPLCSLSLSLFGGFSHLVVVHALCSRPKKGVQSTVWKQRVSMRALWANVWFSLRFPRTRLGTNCGHSARRAFPLFVLKEVPPVQRASPRYRLSLLSSVCRRPKKKKHKITVNSFS